MMSSGRSYTVLAASLPRIRVSGLWMLHFQSPALLSEAQVSPNAT
ncbi:hypothetical protein T261_00203 [Streptomyces lydicus]|nr:hypothetical protein T261_00203 [Streptomyces lydicus]